MKGGRLFQILYCILERGTVTAPDLTEQSEVSVRTICTILMRSVQPGFLSMQRAAGAAGSV